MFHSIRPHPAITATLLDFLCRVCVSYSLLFNINGMQWFLRSLSFALCMLLILWLVFVDHAKLLSAFTWTSPAGGLYLPEGYLGEESATVSHVITFSLVNAFDAERVISNSFFIFKHCVYEVYFASFKMDMFWRLQQIVSCKCWVECWVNVYLYYYFVWVYVLTVLEQLWIFLQIFIPIIWQQQIWSRIKNPHSGEFQWILLTRR